MTDKSQVMSNINSPERPLKVSVLMVTYNHENFIEQAVRSVMMQETDFEYELVIGEDYSTDRTREIVLRLKEEFPNKIIPILQLTNMGATQNFKSVWEQLRGEYIATLEGDDYWTDPHKLQIQADFMDDNADCSICFHGFQVLDDATKSIIDTIEDSNVKFSIMQIFNPGKLLFHLSACMARISLLPKLPDWFIAQPLVGDVPLFSLFADKGVIGFINRCMSVYRKNLNSSWTGGDPLRNTEYATIAYTQLDRHFNQRYSTIIRITRQYMRSAKLLYRARQMRTARAYAFSALRSYRRDPSVSLSEIQKLILKTYLYQIGLKFDV